MIISSSSSNNEDYLKIRAQQVWHNLFGKRARVPSIDDYELGYSLEFLTVEAFELTYGYPWDETKHIIASVVSLNIFDMKKIFQKSDRE